MKKITIIIGVALLIIIFVAPTQNVRATECLTISKYPSYGMRGNDVLAVQNFLVSQGLLTVSPTGYYGVLTRSAVSSFQSTHGITVTGNVDIDTLNAMQKVSCTTQGQAGYNYSYQPLYGYTGSQTGMVNISQITPNYGGVGTVVTIYGSGFDSSSNRVLINGNLIGTYSSYNGTIVFTIPSNTYSYCPMTYGCTTGSSQISVSNQYGTSNSLPFSLSGYYQNPSQNYYQNCYPYSSYNNCYNNIAPGVGAPTISITTTPSDVTTGYQANWSLMVTDPMRSFVTVSARWGDENIGSSGGTNSLSLFASPSISSSISHTYQYPGTYTAIFTATNSAGLQSTIASTINVTGSATGGGSVYISYLSPSQGQIGTQVTIQGSGFSTNNNIVHFSYGGTMGVSSQNGSTIYYTIPRYISTCDTIVGTSCQSAPVFVNPGTYSIYVSNGLGQSSTANFTVTQ